MEGENHTRQPLAVSIGLKDDQGSKASLQNPGAHASAFQPGTTLTFDDASTGAADPPCPSSSSVTAGKRAWGHGETLLEVNISMDDLRSLSLLGKASSDSPWYMLTGPRLEASLPFMSEMEDEKFARLCEYAKGALDEKKTKTFGRITFQILYFTLLLSALYLAFIGHPLWDGIVYSFWYVHVSVILWRSLRNTSFPRGVRIVEL